MKNWFSCIISPGQFTGEFAVRGELFDGSGFSLFAQSEDIRFKEEEPSEGKSVDGWIRVSLLDQKEDMFLVSLPQSTFENGQAITVSAARVTGDKDDSFKR